MALVSISLITTLRSLPHSVLSIILWWAMLWCKTLFFLCSTSFHANNQKRLLRIINGEERHKKSEMKNMFEVCYAFFRCCRCLRCPGRFAAFFYEHISPTPFVMLPFFLILRLLCARYVSFSKVEERKEGEELKPKRDSCSFRGCVGGLFSNGDENDGRASWTKLSKQLI